MTAHDAVDLTQFLKELFRLDRGKSIRSATCIPPPLGCGKDATEFRDELRRREYRISGFCQECQDKVFKEE